MKSPLQGLEKLFAYTAMRSLWKVMLVVAALLDVTTGQTNTTQSGCEVCASMNDCSRAYQSAPGQFCGNWLDRQNDRRPCCCPANAMCKLSNYACNCHYSGDEYPYRGGSGWDGLVWLWSLLGSLALLLCCCGCCFMVSKRMKDRRYQDSNIPVATPVTSQETGRVSGQPYLQGGTSAAYSRDSTQPAYANATNYGQNRGGMGAGTGAALGGTAGLLGGLMLGGALADHGNDSYGLGNDGGDFGGGGGNFGGDF